MNEYLMLFWNEAGDGSYAPTPEELKASMEAWQQWIGHIAMKGKLISTKPIQYDGVQVTNEGVLQQPAVKAGDMVTGYLIAKADNLAEAQGWADTCPILAFPKGAVEIREVVPFDL